MLQVINKLFINNPPRFPVEEHLCLIQLLLCIYFKILQHVLMIWWKINDDSLKFLIVVKVDCVACKLNSLTRLQIFIRKQKKRWWLLYFYGCT